MTYDDDELLPLSGIQHYSFCPRQWALIHMAQEWAENALTVQGGIVHKRAHDASLRERRGDTIELRSVNVCSRRLGLVGQCDVVEFTQTESGVTLAGEEGLWSVFPIEYKRGHRKSIDADRLQLCAQAMALEEMLCCEIGEACLYYHETRSRERVILDSALREETRRCAREMHRLFSRKHIPRARSRPSCRSCSIKDVCLPATAKRESVSGYYQRRIGEVL
ncbi:CRISPR-associated protein Cas4 [Adlercreutzia caecimuris]|uniref:CRISPR-associated exonuclease Cas4 n=1 Tax=Adlercreutzia caecimuris TaxID=671266 RepID=A0A4S4FXR4_9ACTN|nr:CRISPR-associated protein Cas4 [Adlercreutzia caecimuris]NBJ65774.1 CRISPR-associated protein Cas4 [Adlercreutzia caecimuris]THG34795.1 CRISPR-associated protein Cas4 [Adlercreutzia caecimuris]